MYLFVDRTMTSSISTLVDLWNTKYMNKQMNILSQINALHALPSYAFNIQFHTILPSMPRSYKWSLSFRFPHLNPVKTSPLLSISQATPPITLFLIWSPEQYFVNSTHHKTPQCTISPSQYKSQNSSVQFPPVSTNNKTPQCTISSSQYKSQNSTVYNFPQSVQITKLQSKKYPSQW
jgi:hypothetical protein